MALRGSAEGRDFREGLCSAKGNRTPIARMKILSTNRYTMAPGAVSRYGRSGLRPIGHCSLLPKKRAKVLLFFDMTKYFDKKMQIRVHFL